MAPAAFDTLKVGRDLEASGFERNQAEGEVANVIGGGQENLVTKETLEAALAKLEASLTLRTLGIAACVVAAIKLIP